MSEMDAEKPLYAREPRQTMVTDQPLFDAPEPWSDYWWGMPEYVMEDCRPYVTLSVHFAHWDDVENFARITGARILRDTKSIWYSTTHTMEQPKDWCYV